jgi:AcrR family transcriptional regulator
MPRIEAANIEEHVRLQTGRILSAATQLFRELGYRGTDMEDIAHAVGLARNSLYRYYPNKDHILLACVLRDMVPFVEEMKSLETRYPDPLPRISAWLDTQIEIATSPAHATMEFMGEVREGAPELRKQIIALHNLPNAVLEGAVSELLKGKRRDVQLVTVLIAGMVEAASRQAIRHGNKAAVKRELRRMVESVLIN